MEAKIKLPSVELINQNPGIQGMYEHIERCGRNCYRSDFKGGHASVTFVDAMVTSGHGAMLEHGTVYLTIFNDRADCEPHPLVYNPHTRACRVIRNNKAVDYITTNYRVLVETGWLDLLSHWSEPTEHHIKRVTCMFDTNIGISREFNRHRVNSVAESSTRYCNMTKEKHGGAVKVIEPAFLRDKHAALKLTAKETEFINFIEDIALHNDSGWTKIDFWLFSVEASNYCYQNLIRLGCKPEEARDVLTLSTNTQLIHTAFVDDWEHFFALRASDTKTNHPHAMALELASQLQELMSKQA